MNCFACRAPKTFQNKRVMSSSLSNQNYLMLGDLFAYPQRHVTKALLYAWKCRKCFSWRPIIEYSNNTKNQKKRKTIQNCCLSNDEDTSIVEKYSGKLLLHEVILGYSIFFFEWINNGKKDNKKCHIVTQLIDSQQCSDWTLSTLQL